MAYQTKTYRINSKCVTMFKTSMAIVILQNNNKAIISTMINNFIIKVNKLRQDPYKFNVDLIITNLRTITPMGIDNFINKNFESKKTEILNQFTSLLARLKLKSPSSFINQIRVKFKNRSTIDVFKHRDFIGKTLIEEFTNICKYINLHLSLKQKAIDNIHKSCSGVKSSKSNTLLFEIMTNDKYDDYETYLLKKYKTYLLNKEDYTLAGGGPDNNEELISINNSINDIYKNVNIILNKLRTKHLDIEYPDITEDIRYINNDIFFYDIQHLLALRDIIDSQISKKRFPSTILHSNKTDLLQLINNLIELHKRRDTLINDAFSITSTELDNELVILSTLGDNNETMTDEEFKKFEQQITNNEHYITPLPRKTSQQIKNNKAVDKEFANLLKEQETKNQEQHNLRNHKKKQLYTPYTPYNTYNTYAGGARKLKKKTKYSKQNVKSKSKSQKKNKLQKKTKIQTR